MKMNLLFTAFMVLAAIAFLFVSDRAESLDITKIIQGTVKEAKVDSITIKNSADGKEIRIAINSYTVYNNVQRLTDLKQGDKVQVEYQAGHNINIATTITKIEEEADYEKNKFFERSINGRAI